MLFSSFALAALSLTSSVLAAPTCAVKEKRKSWRSLTNTEKLKFIAAEKCLMSKPAKQGYPGAITRWDDLQYAHIQLTNVVHDVGAFLPWHRYYVYVLARLLKEECGYKGVFPYWDEVRDVGTGLLAASPVFDNVYGFGGNGRASDGCVVDGPFANTTVHLGPAYQVTNYCLRRTFNEARFTGAAQSSVDVCNAYNDYVSYAFCLEASPHGAGHIGVGGLQLDNIASPGDPMFFMHHAYIDYQWWNWQKANLTSRLVDMGGRNTPDPAYFVRSPLIKPVPAAWYEVDGDPGNVTTLNHNLGSLGIYPNATIKDVMNIQGGYLCYEYV